MRTPRTPRSLLSGAALFAALAFALAACGGGGGGGNDDVATLGDDTSSDDGADASGGDDEVSDAEREDAMLAFAECMREHGVDMPDPTFDGEGGAGRVEIGVRGDEADMDAMQEAQEACDHLLEDAMGERPQLSPEEEAEMRDRMLAFSECMREHGIDMPDPEFDGNGGVMIGPGPGAEGAPDFSDEDFQEAEEACRGELGVEDGEGPGGGPVIGFESSGAKSASS